jgi:superfamily II DNA/RNA helicase
MFKQSFNNQSFRKNRVYPKFRFNKGNNYPKKSISNSQYINKIDIQLHSQNKNPNQGSFTNLDIDPRLKQNIASRGYHAPTPIQNQAIGYILKGRDLVGIANTGTGKTAAFLIPLIDKIIKNRTEKVLIIVPTRELAMQINDEVIEFAKGLNIFSLLCIGGASMQRQIHILKRHPSIIVAAPGRLKDLMQRGYINLNNFKNIVLDEVDRMLDIGFLPEIKYIISYLPEKRQSLFFSATVSADINNIISTFTKDHITVSVKAKETAQNIDQDIIKVRDKKEKIDKLIDMLKQPGYNKILVFGRTKWGVEKLAKILKQNGFLAADIHGKKTQGQRFKALNQFKNNQLQVLVATDIAARGLDIDNVSHVINFDEPASYNDYIHRIGRTGRAHKIGKALTFVI